MYLTTNPANHALCCLLLAVLTNGAAPTLTALPPGYEDEILCNPSSACLRRVHRPYGWSGARTDFVECCEPVTGKVSRPRSWGVRLDLAYREELIHNGWGTARQCNAFEDKLCDSEVKGRNMEIHGMLSMMESLEGAVYRLSDLYAVRF
jgi:hypothetical protein